MNPLVDVAAHREMLEWLAVDWSIMGFSSPMTPGVMFIPISRIRRIDENGMAWI